MAALVKFKSDPYLLLVAETPVRKMTRVLVSMHRGYLFIQTNQPLYKPSDQGPTAEHQPLLQLNLNYILLVRDILLIPRYSFMRFTWSNFQSSTGSSHSTTPCDPQRNKLKYPSLWVFCGMWCVSNLIFWGDFPKTVALFMIWMDSHLSQNPSGIHLKLDSSLRAPFGGMFRGDLYLPGVAGYGGPS